ncbi:MAG: hypothetical protein QXW66_01910, partial [Archaeoglobaceae archaeon]
MLKRSKNSAVSIGNQASLFQHENRIGRIYPSQLFILTFAIKRKPYMVHEYEIIGERMANIPAELSA